MDTDATMNTGDTIAAIASASGPGAIAIVRLSGSAVFSILSKIFRPHSAGLEGRKAYHRDNFEGYKAYHGFLIDPAVSGDKGTIDKEPIDREALDEVVVITYRVPHSYTGEDLAEINCHGGSLISRQILELLIIHGARLARPGEFTQRAYLSGRLDLTQAEAVLDVIQAKTRRQGKLAVCALSGHLGRKIAGTRLSLVDLLTRITAGIDFPDEVGDTPVEEIVPTLEESVRKLQELSQTALSGRFLREGLRLAIVGRPNAGKSSLLNQLLKFERAIVTDTPGTTRDSIEEQIDLNGIPVTLIDTAGIRPTDDHVERMGIERSRHAVESADLIVFLVDLLQGWQDPEQQIQNLIAARPHIIVFNKTDAIAAQHPIDTVSVLRPHSVPDLNGAQELFVSAKTGQGIDKLSEAVEQWVFGNSSLQEQGGTLNERQAQLCIRAIEALQSALVAVHSQLPQDCIASDLKMAVDHLSEISGASVSEEVIGQVFANFCIGK